MARKEKKKEEAITLAELERDTRQLSWLNTFSTITDVLDVDVAADGKTIAPKGTAVYGKVLESIGGRRLGNQKIVIQLACILKT